MVDKNKLKGMIVERAGSQRNLAKTIEMPEATWYVRMRDCSFTVPEVALIRDALSLTDDELLRIFFADENALKA